MVSARLPGSRVNVVNLQIDCRDCLSATCKTVHLLATGGARGWRRGRRRGAQDRGWRAQRASTSDSPGLSDRSERSERREFPGAAPGRAPQRSRRARADRRRRSRTRVPPGARRAGSGADRASARRLGRARPVRCRSAGRSIDGMRPQRAGARHQGLADAGCDDPASADAELGMG